MTYLPGKVTAPPPPKVAKPSLPTPHLMAVCQELSNKYKILAGGSFGTAPEPVRSFFKTNHCTTSPLEAAHIAVVKPAVDKELEAPKGVLSKADNLLAAVRDPKAAAIEVAKDLAPMKALVARIEQLIAGARGESAAAKATLDQIKSGLPEAKSVIADAERLLKAQVSDAAATAQLTKLAPRLKWLSDGIGQGVQLLSQLSKVAGVGATAAQKVAAELHRAKGVFANAQNVAAEVKNTGAAAAQAAQALAKDVGAKAAADIVKEAKNVAALAPQTEAPAVIPKPQTVTQVVASLGAGARQKVEVKPAESSDVAPVVQAKRGAGAEGMRTALRAVYSLLSQDWRAGLLAAKALQGGAASKTEGDVLQEVTRAVGEFRASFHSAYRLLHSIRVLQLRALYHKGVEAQAAKIGRLLTAEASGLDVEGDLSGLEGMGQPFANLKDALTRLAQNGERFLNAAAVLLGPRRRKIVQRSIRTFTGRLTRAKAALDKIVQTVAEAAGGAQDSSAEDSSDEG